MRTDVSSTDNPITKKKLMNDNTPGKDVLLVNNPTEITIEPSSVVKSRKKGILAYPKNPFWRPHEVAIGTKKVTIDSGYVTKDATGQTLDFAAIHRVEIVDEDRFVKLFTQNMHHFFDLTPASQKLLQYVLLEVQDNPRCEGIYVEWIQVQKFIEKFNYKMGRATYHRAILEMLEKGFLAESERANYFWINVHLFFNGDRMVFIQEYRKAPKARAKPALEASANPPLIER